MSKVWFVTGSSRGFGRLFVEAALGRGDRVAATARNPDVLGDLVTTYGEAVLPLTLDVTDRAAAGRVVTEAHRHFGRLDVVVNNAGYGHFGCIEEITEAEARAQFETNMFGALWVTQAVIPLLRGQGSGHIVQISSIGGVGAYPNLGIYNASKWALEGFSEALAWELRDFGVKVTIVEPGGYATDWAGSSASASTPDPAYQPRRDEMAAMWGDPAAVNEPAGAAAALLRVVDAEDPPLRVLFSSHAYNLVQDIYAERLRTWQQWQDVSHAAGRG